MRWLPDTHKADILYKMDGDALIPISVILDGKDYTDPKEMQAVFDCIVSENRARIAAGEEAIVEGV